SLDDTTLLVKAQGDSVPSLSQFMPDGLVSSLIRASQAAKPTRVTYTGLSYSKDQTADFSSPITVYGDLTISGSGSYMFDSVYVTGNVTINGSLVFSFASLRVGGNITVRGGTAL